MHPAVALILAATCFGTAAWCYRFRDTVLLWVARLRGLAVRRCDGSPGAARVARRRYLRSRRASLDMALPIVLLILFGIAFLVRGLTTLR